MTIYSPEIADKVCAAIACGDSVEKICQAVDMPGERTVYEWLIRYPEFLIKYDLAKEKQMEIFANQIIDLADKCSPNNDAAAKAKLQIEARKWVMGKLKPKKYGDNMTIKGDADNPIQLTLATALDARIAAARAAPTIEHEASSTALPVIDAITED
jgi:hypothetical protein